MRGGPSKALGSDAAVVRITGLPSGAGGEDVAVFIRVNVAIGIPGTTKNRTAAAGRR